MRPLVPLATGWTPQLPLLSGIRGVAFDLYGTLLISAAGGGGDEKGAGGSEDAVLERHYWESVRDDQARRRAAGVAFPEVEIREVWADLRRRRGMPPLSPEETEDEVVEHECRVNPVWPMPGAVDLLAELRRRDLPLGIVSNAQFYTAPMVETLFGADFAALGFRRELCIFSYEEGEGKPSLRLYEHLRDRVGALGLAPEEVFYLGNDLQKDVLPARALGFRTGLFAGDARSLRIGEVSSEEARALADAVVTDLAQVPGLLQG